MADKVNQTSSAPGADEVKDNLDVAENTGENTGNNGNAVNEKAADDNTDVVESDLATRIIESNNAVIASNDAVIEAIESFKEAAGDVAAQIVKRVQEAASGQVITKHRELPTIKPGTKYVVASGKRFQDKDNPDWVYQPGDDVTKIGNDRLVKLISQGIVIEAGDDD